MVVFAWFKMSKTQTKSACFVAKCAHRLCMRAQPEFLNRFLSNLRKRIVVGRSFVLGPGNSAPLASSWHGATTLLTRKPTTKDWQDTQPNSHFENLTPLLTPGVVLFCLFYYNFVFFKIKKIFILKKYGDQTQARFRSFCRGERSSRPSRDLNEVLSSRLRRFGLNLFVKMSP